MNKSYWMKALLAGLVLMAPAVWAQGNAPAGGAPAGRKAMSPAQAEMKALNDQMRAELKGVSTGTLTPEQKRDARKAILEKYRPQRMALMKKYRGDAKPRAAISQDRRKVRRMIIKQKAAPAEAAPAPAQ